jgi:voltage-gated potassium channel
MSQFGRFAIAFVLLSALIGGGTVGYSLIEGWGPGDSLYMTVITVTTVGYGEVKDLSTAGRYFTIALIVFSIATLGYSVTTLIGFIFEGQIVKAVRGRRMQRDIERIQDHYIICGCGVVGKEVAIEFIRAGVPFVIVERDLASAELPKDESLLVIEGDAVADEVLIEAGIERARGLISALRDDGLNVFVVLTARQLNPKLKIVARAAEERTVSKLMKAGADRVISPFPIAGRRMASAILRPSVVDFLDVVMEGGGVALRMEEVRVRAASPLLGRSLRDSEIGQRTDAKVIGIHGPDGRPRTGQSANASLSSIILQEGDCLIVLGSEPQLKSLKEFADQKV